MTSVSWPVSRSPGSSRSSSVRLACMRPGSTMNRSPAMKAVISASRDSPRMSLARIGVSAATSPGSTHRLTSSATATYATR